MTNVLKPMLLFFLNCLLIFQTASGQIDHSIQVEGVTWQGETCRFSLDLFSSSYAELVVLDEASNSYISIKTDVGNGQLSFSQRLDLDNNIYIKDRLKKITVFRNSENQVIRVSGFAPLYKKVVCNIPYIKKDISQEGDAKTEEFPGKRIPSHIIILRNLFWILF